MPEAVVIADSNLWIGGILKQARLRLGLTPDQLGIAIGLKSSGRMVRLWESDKRDIGGHMTTVEKVLAAYQLNDKEKTEVVRRITLRRQHHVADKINNPLDIEPSVEQKKKILAMVSDLLAKNSAISNDLAVLHSLIASSFF